MHNQSTFRKRDMNVEREMANFLDNHLYCSPLFTYKQRTNDIESQLKGSDIIISVPTKSIDNAIVDEKAQTQYINRPLPTFAFELSFVTANNHVAEGWLTSSDKNTDYYLLQWIHKSTENWNVVESDIKELEYALIKRSDILHYMEDHNYGIEQLREKCNLIRQNDTHGACDKGSNDFWFFYSPQLFEKPINIVIRKKVLIDMSVLHGVINIESKKEQ